MSSYNSPFILTEVLQSFPVIALFPLSMVLSFVESVEDFHHGHFGPFNFKLKQKTQGYFISRGHVLLQVCELLLAPELSW